MICHNQKCIFVHIPKTGGQSIEHFFLELNDSNWRNRAPFLLRKNPNRKVGPPVLSHLTASEYVSYKYLSQDLFDQYFKFAIVRNPWNRVYSFYKFNGYSKLIDFKTYVLDYLEQHELSKRYFFLRPQVEFIYSQKGDSLVDFIGKLENMQNDFDIVCQKLNLPISVLKHINQSKTKDRVVKKANNLKKNIPSLKNKEFSHDYSKKYRDVYDNETKLIVEKIYSKDMALGYDF